MVEEGVHNFTKGTSLACIVEVRTWDSAAILFCGHCFYQNIARCRYSECIQRVLEMINNGFNTSKYDAVKNRQGIWPILWYFMMESKTRIAPCLVVIHDAWTLHEVV